MMKRIASLLLSASLLSASLCGCAWQGNDTALTESLPQDTTAADTPKEEVRYTYRVAYRDIDFLPDTDRAKWRDSLIHLISNEAIPVYGEDSLDGYRYPDPDRPGIEKGISLGLFDINMDGVPELLVDLGGGSSCNAFYYVYDIQSGENLGSLQGSLGDSWCIYFNTVTGKYEVIGQYQWRFGWAGKGRFITKIMIAESRGSLRDDLLYQHKYLEAFYTIDLVNVEVSEEDREAGIEGFYNEVYNGTTFQVNGQTTSIEAYFYEYDCFLRDMMRLPETDMRLIARRDYASPEEIADALLSTDQKFVNFQTQAPKTDNNQ